MRPRRAHFAVLAATGLVLCASTARADGWAPTLVIIWAPMIVLLVPVIWIEAIMAGRVLSIDRADAWRVSWKANLFSALLGVPLAAIPTLVIAFKAEHLTVDATPTVRRIMQVLLCTGVVLEDRSIPNWVRDAGLTLSCVIAFLMSVYSERWLVRRLYPKVQPSALRRWSWIANAMSYVVLAVCMGGFVWMKS